MRLCLFNPEHDLCLANGRASYVPPQSAVDFARSSAQLMQVLYPDALCTSVYDLCWTSPTPPSAVLAWGWDAVVKRELLKRGIADSLLPTDEEIASIRQWQHRSTLLPLQPDCHQVHSAEEVESLLAEHKDMVMKAPWSGSGRGLRWVTSQLSGHDRSWLEKTVADQQCVMAEPRRQVVADVALEYQLCASPSPQFTFIGYSYFRTSGGVYRENYLWNDERIADHFRHTDLQATRLRVEQWIQNCVVGHYNGPLGIDLMVCPNGSVHVAEANFRHTMGMVAHARVVQMEAGS